MPRSWMQSSLAKRVPTVVCILATFSIILHISAFGFSSRRWKLVPKFRLFRVGSVSKLEPHSIILTRNTSNNIYKPVNQTCTSENGTLLGRLEIDLEWALENYWVESRMNPEVSDKGGSSSLLGHCDEFENPALVNLVAHPDGCIGQKKVAIIIPFRDRDLHLKISLGHLIPILRKQLTSFSIFVVEQDGIDTFNKGRLFNTGFKFAVQAGNLSGIPYDCFIFHDVDMLSEYDTLMYRCSDGESVDHLSVAIDKFKYRTLCCGMTVGGVLAMKEEQFRAINGFPTEYWGWGGEDDDVNKRIRAKGLKIVRPAEPLGRFSMIKHERDEHNPMNEERKAILREAKERFVHKLRPFHVMETQGLKQIDTKIIKMAKCPLFTKIVVDVGKAPARNTSVSRTYQMDSSETTKPSISTRKRRRKG